MSDELLKCECAEPAEDGAVFCTRYGRDMERRPWEICSNNCPASRPCSQRMRHDYINRWMHGVIHGNKPPHHRATVTVSKNGIGTQLRLLLESLGLASELTCRCKALARAMDEGGEEWCVQNREGILRQLRDAQKRLRWSKTIEAALKTAKTAVLWEGLAWKVGFTTDPAPAILDEAIRRAKAEPAR